ncbi:non-specific lipid-transfer protein 1-like [Aristolochia californica]|uniref:non-specific lipid-transfer protein 1-like n=1 Tax=Aristolochia californica TaxID=171875 RepID=UPI0035D79BAC
MAPLPFRNTLVGFLLCSLVAAPYAVAAVITCNQVVVALTPCIDYLRYGGQPSSVCCTGLQGLNSAATTTFDRQTVCSCVKRAATAVTGLVYQQEVSLPAKCGLHVPYQITPTTDCSKVQ